jgi:CRP/FNR family transcriptional regulator
MIGMTTDIFDQSPFFKDMSAQQRNLLKPLFTACDCVEGELLFEQGDPADYLYLVESGEVIVRYKPEDGPEIIVARVKTGGIVGWSAALGSRHYTSGAICGTDSQLLCVRGADLRQLCSQHPETGVLVLEKLADVIAERLNSTHQEVVKLLKQGLVSAACAR